MDLCDLQTNCFLQPIVKWSVEDIWKPCWQDNFPTLRGILSLFRSTYGCESAAFSTTNLIKSKLETVYSGYSVRIVHRVDRSQGVRLKLKNHLSKNNANRHFNCLNRTNFKYI